MRKLVPRSGPGPNSETASWFDWFANVSGVLLLIFLLVPAWQVPVQFDTWLRLVELFIAVAGFIIPAWRVLTRRRKIFRTEFLSRCEGWLYAPTALLVAGTLHAVTRIAHEIHQPVWQRIGNGELREFIIAWFLMWYLVSYFIRLRSPDIEICSF